MLSTDYFLFTGVSSSAERDEPPVLTEDDPSPVANVGRSAAHLRIMHPFASSTEELPDPSLAVPPAVR